MMTKLILKLSVLAVFTALFSCNPERQLMKAEARLAQAGRLPSICADRFPITDTTYLVDTLVKTDTLLTQEYIIDTVSLNDTLYEIKYKPVTIYKTKYLTKVEVRVNRAKERAYQVTIGQLEAKLAALESESTKYKGLAKSRLFWLILLCTAFLGYSVRKPIWNIIKWNLRIS